MKRLRPVHISILAIIVFVAALILGMQSEWWVLDGRKTPLDSNFGRGHGDEADEDYFGTIEEHIETEEDHETGQVSGNSTVQDALDLGITIDELEEILEGKLDDKDALIQDIVAQRGLRFGYVKDTINAVIND